MANEARGKLAEAAIYVSLHSLGTTWTRKYGSLRAHSSPSGFLVVPDLTSGNNQDAPTVVFAVSCIGSVKESNRKFWRNIAELIDCKRLHPPARLACINIGAFKEGLWSIQSAITDCAIDVSARNAGRTLAKWIDSNAAGATRLSFEQAIDLVKDASAGSRSLAAALSDLADSVVQGLEITNTKALKCVECHSDLVRSRQLPESVEHTLFRHAFAVISVSREPNAVLDHVFKRLPLVDHGSELMLLGLTTPSIKGLGLRPEIVNHLTRVGRKLCEAVVAGAPRIQMRALAAPIIRAAQQLKLMHWVNSNWSAFGRAGDAFSLLFPEVKSPEHNITGDSLTERQRQAISAVIDLVKRSRKKSQGTGYSQLLESVRRTRSDEAARLAFVAEARSLFGKQHAAEYLISGSTETIRLGFQELRNGPSRQKFLLRAIDLFAILYEIAKLLPDESQLVSSDDEGVGEQQAKVMERVRNYKNFEPLWHVVEAALKEAGLDFQFDRRYPSSLVEIAQESADHIDPRSARTEFITCGNTIIHVKSAFGAANVGHKVKELAGRIAFSRVKYEGNGKVSPREGLKKAILVIDGTWDAEDVEHLWRSGFDAVFYPHEMSELVAAIK